MRGILIENLGDIEDASQKWRHFFSFLQVQVNLQRKDGIQNQNSISDLGEAMTTLLQADPEIMGLYDSSYFQPGLSERLIFEYCTSKREEKS